MGPRSGAFGWWPSTAGACMTSLWPCGASHSLPSISSALHFSVRSVSGRLRHLPRRHDMTAAQPLAAGGFASHLLLRTAMLLLQQRPAALLWCLELAGRPTVLAQPLSPQQLVMPAAK